MAAYSPTGPHKLMKLQRLALGPKAVAIKLHYCGVCSDIHTIRAEWGKLQYPQSVGHELAGEVVAVGSRVSKFPVVARVGVGTRVNACRLCTECPAGHENYCLNGNVNQRAKVSRLSGKTASKKDHPDVVNPPALTGVTWSDLRGNRVRHLDPEDFTTDKAAPFTWRTREVKGSQWRNTIAHVRD